MRLMGRTSGDWTAWRSPKLVAGTRQSQIAERVPDAPLSPSARVAVTLQAMVLTSHGYWRAREASDPAAASCDSSSTSHPRSRPGRRVSSTLEAGHCNPGVVRGERLFPSPGSPRTPPLPLDGTEVTGHQRVTFPNRSTASARRERFHCEIRIVASTQNSVRVRQRTGVRRENTMGRFASDLRVEFTKNTFVVNVLCAPHVLNS